MDFVFTGLEEKHIASLVNLSNEGFGQGYHDETYFYSFLSIPNKKCFVALYQHQIIGFSTVGCYHLAQLRQTIEPYQLNYWIALLNEEVKTGYRHQTYVCPKFRNKGIGKQLFKRSNQWLYNNNLDIIITVLWLNSSNSLKNWVEKDGFVLYKTIDGYWSEESVKKNYYCAICSKPPCHCSAAVYFKSLSSRKI